jgi:hypothetical protein
MSVVRIMKTRSLMFDTLTVMHAAEDGGPTLRDHSSWRTVNGLLVNTRWGCWSWTFRRHDRSAKS